MIEPCEGIPAGDRRASRRQQAGEIILQCLSHRGLYLEDLTVPGDTRHGSGIDPQPSGHIQDSIGGGEEPLLVLSCRLTAALLEIDPPWDISPTLQEVGDLLRHLIQKGHLQSHLRPALWVEVTSLEEYPIGRAIGPLPT